MGQVVHKARGKGQTHRVRFEEPVHCGYGSLYAMGVFSLRLGSTAGRTFLQLAAACGPL